MCVAYDTVEMLLFYSIFQTGGGASLGVNVNGFGGSLGLDISVLEHSKRNTSKTNIRTKLISAGSRAVPLPISLVLRNISEALDPEYWTNSLQDGVTYRSLGIACKQENLVKALEDYPDFEGAKELTGIAASKTQGMIFTVF